jgi:Pectate lyase superfamily protein
MIVKRFALYLVTGLILFLSLSYFLFACSFPSFTTSSTENITFPPDANILNVKDFGAEGDGRTDDTNALQEALNTGSNGDTILYIPNGTYKVSKRLHFYRHLTVQGQSESGTIIKLQDNAEEYQDPKKPNYVLASTNEGTISYKPPGDNMAFLQFMMNLTIDTGKGNLGAGGLLYISNNGGGLRNVTIRSEDGRGVVGLDFRAPWDGPALYRGVSVDGFDVGIWAGHTTVSTDMDHITLRNQRVVGIRNDEHPLTIRKLKSENTVPAIEINGAWGLTVLFDSELIGRNSSKPAIVHNEGQVYAFNVRISDYPTPVMGQGARSFKDGYLAYSSQSFQSLANRKAIKTTAIDPSFSNSKLTPLPIVFKDTPSVPWEPLSNWVSVTDFAHLIEDKDWTPAIQAAIDSGHSTVYFPNGEYYLKDTIIIRGSVRVLQGLNSFLFPLVPGSFKDKPLIRVEDGTPPQVFIDRVAHYAKSPGETPVFLENATSRDLIIINSRGLSYRNTSTGTGNLFLDDMVTFSVEFNYPQQAYLHQLDLEGQQNKVINKAAQVYIQGFKSEGTGTLVSNIGSDALTVVLGGQDYPANDALSRTEKPSNINIDGTLLMVQSLFYTNNTLVKETLNGVTRNYDRPVGERFLFFSSINPEIDFSGLQDKSRSQ